MNKELFENPDAFRILSNAEAAYKRIKMEKHPYRAPETLPSIESDQVKALMIAIGMEIAAIKFFIIANSAYKGAT